MVSARAWCRVDVAGGTLDIWPLGLFHDDSRTVNLAIDVPVDVELLPRSKGYLVCQGDERVEVETAAGLLEHAHTAIPGLVAQNLELPPVEIRMSSGSPRGGGLGASSALTVALLAAGEAWLDRERSDVTTLCAVARDIEARLMKLPTGTQDHFAAALGGALEITYPPGGVRAFRIEIDLEEVSRSLVVAYTGQSHFSAGKNWQVVRNRLDGEARTGEHFAAIARIAGEAGEALRASDLAAVGRLMAAEWQHRRQLAEGISTPVIERLLEAAVAAGAWGGKACGAGGGGCIAVLCPPPRRGEVLSQFESLGARPIPARVVNEPLRVSA